MVGVVRKNKIKSMVSPMVFEIARGPVSRQAEDLVYEARRLEPSERPLVGVAVVCKYRGTSLRDSLRGEAHLI